MATATVETKPAVATLASMYSSPTRVALAMIIIANCAIAMITEDLNGIPVPKIANVPRT